MVDKTSKKAKTKKVETKKPTKQDIYYAIFLVLWAGLSIFASQMVVAFPMVFLLGIEKFQTPFWTLIYYIICDVLALGLVFLVPSRLFTLYQSRRKLKTTENILAPSAAEIGVSKPPTFVDIGLAPIGYVVYIVAANIIINFFSFFSWFNADEEQNIGFSRYLSGGDRIMAILAVVFLAPIVEELIMRGWLYGKLRRRLGIVVSIFLTSIIFAVLHGQLNVGISVFLLSCALCGLREITGTVWSSILLHILTNGIAFYTIYIAGF